MMKGIDVSHWNGEIDFAQVKAAGYSFVMIKAGGKNTGGFYTDPKFEKNYSAAIQQGLYVGAYYYTSADFFTAEEGKAEAVHFMELLQGKKFEMPVAVDIEEVSVSKGKTGITDACIDFCKYIEANKYYAIIYASDISGFGERLELDRLTPYDKWVARYNSSGPVNVKQYGMWQYGGSVNKLNTAKVPGVSSIACDQNVSNKNYPNIMRNACLNGFTSADKDSDYRNMFTVTVSNISEGDKDKIVSLLSELQLKYHTDVKRV